MTMQKPLIAELQSRELVLPSLVLDQDLITEPIQCDFDLCPHIHENFIASSTINPLLGQMRAINNGARVQIEDQNQVALRTRKYEVDRMSMNDRYSPENYRMSDVLNALYYHTGLLAEIIKSSAKVLHYNNEMEIFDKILETWDYRTDKDVGHEFAANVMKQLGICLDVAQTDFKHHYKKADNHTPTLGMFAGRYIELKECFGMDEYYNDKNPLTPNMPLHFPSEYVRYAAYHAANPTPYQIRGERGREAEIDNTPVDLLVAEIKAEKDTK